MSKLSATSYVVLGLVAERPSSGYDLAAFAEGSIGQFFPLTRSHIYSELERLSRLGLLQATEVEAERYATKRVYTITAEGVEVLRGWLDDPRLPAERQRNVFLVRVFFGDQVSPGRIEGLLDSYEQAAHAWRDELVALVDSLAARPEAAFRRATAMYGVEQLEAKLRWLEQVRPLLLEAGGQQRKKGVGHVSSIDT
jgi:PadR family transcriptional regulator, regulatory protein AphA